MNSRVTTERWSDCLSVRGPSVHPVGVYFINGWSISCIAPAALIIYVVIFNRAPVHLPRIDTVLCIEEALGRSSSLIAAGRNRRPTLWTRQGRIQNLGLWGKSSAEGARIEAPQAPRVYWDRIWGRSIPLPNGEESGEGPSQKFLSFCLYSQI